MGVPKFLEVLRLQDAYGLGWLGESNFSSLSIWVFWLLDGSAVTAETLAACTVSSCGCGHRCLRHSLAR